MTTYTLITLPNGDGIAVKLDLADLKDSMRHPGNVLDTLDVNNNQVLVNCAHVVTAREIERD